MEQKVIESRWINGQHRPKVHPDVKSALHSAIRGERDGSQGHSQIIVSWSEEDCASGKIVMDCAAVSRAGRALDGAHPPAWRNRDKQSARDWQVICNMIKAIKV